MNILTIKNLQKSFKDKKVLCGVDLAIPESSIFGFVGKNGAGKTTTMKAILGLLKIDNGEIYVCDELVKFGQNTTNKYIGYLPDVPEFYSFMTAKEYLNLCGESLEMNKEDINERSEELLSLVGLINEKHRIKGYSRGMKQRLGIAQALLGRPKLLICDEPTSALDPIGRKEILNILRLVKEQTTVLFSTHILSDVERICTHVAFLDGGKIVMQGKIENFKKMHKTNEYKIEFINNEDKYKIINHFKEVRINNNEVIIPTSHNNMNDVYEFIARNDIKIAKIELLETNLESFFMEVISK